MPTPAPCLGPHEQARAPLCPSRHPLAFPPPPPPREARSAAGCGVRGGGARGRVTGITCLFPVRAPWTPGLAWDYAGAVEASRPFPSGGPGSECLGDRAPLFWLRVSCVEINPCPSFFSPRAKEASNLGMGHLLPTPGQLQLSKCWLKSTPQPGLSAHKLCCSPHSCSLGVWGEAAAPQV